MDGQVASLQPGAGHRPSNGRCVRRLALKQVTRMLVVGTVIGLAGALAVGRAAQSLLFDLQGKDPWVVMAVTVLLSAIALGAAYVPALRASRVDPMRALRHE
jgi:ABC-type lipoprotein release transport system permease subunit